MAGARTAVARNAIGARLSAARRLRPAGQIRQRVTAPDSPRANGGRHPRADDDLGHVRAGTASVVRGLDQRTAADQSGNAHTIVAVTQTRGGQRAAVIAVMVALAESDLRVLGNPTVAGGTRPGQQVRAPITTRSARSSRVPGGVLRRSGWTRSPRRTGSSTPCSPCPAGTRTRGSPAGRPAVGIHRATVGGERVAEHRGWQRPHAAGTGRRGRDRRWWLSVAGLRRICHSEGPAGGGPFGLPTGFALPTGVSALVVEEPHPGDTVKVVITASFVAGGISAGRHIA